MLATPTPLAPSPLSGPATMLRPDRALATTDPLAATESFNLFEEGFAAFLRTSRTPRTLPGSAHTAPQGLSPRLHGVYGMSPRLPSALPPSASPRVVEPVTPDRGQPVLPFYSADDAIDLGIPERDREKEERLRRLEWARSAPVAPVANTDVGVVDEDAADRMFSTAPRKPATPTATPLALSFPPTASGTTPMPDAPQDDFPPPATPLRAPSPRDAEIVLHMPPMLAPLRAVPAAYQLAWSTPMQTPKDPFARPPQPHFAAPPSRPELPDLHMASLARSDAHMSSPAASTGTSPRHTLFARADDAVRVRKRPPRRNSDEMDDDTSPRKRQELPSVPPPAPAVDATLQAPHPAPRFQPPPRVVSGSDPADPLRCHMCGQRFARVSNLRKHLRSVHELTRRFVCEVCSYKFKRQDHLLKHKRSVHAKVRNFSCEICGSEFAEKFNRDKHQRSIHDTKRAFQCGCGAYHQDRDKMHNCLRCKRNPTF